MLHNKAVTLYFVSTGTYGKTSDFIKRQSEKITESRYKT